jgi:CDP-diglyceride synthetase
VIGQRFYRIPHDWLKIVVGVIFAGSIAVLIPLFPFNDLTRWIFNLLALFTFIPLMMGIGLLRTDEISTVRRSIQARFFAPRD